MGTRSSRSDRRHRALIAVLGAVLTTGLLGGKVLASGRRGMGTPATNAASSSAAGTRDAGAASRSGSANIDVSNNSAADAEPAIAVDPLNPQVLLVAAQLVRNHHAVAGTFVSVNGGRNWSANGPLPLPAGGRYSANLTVGFDSKGEAYVAGLVQSATSAFPVVWRSADAPQGFSNPVIVAPQSFTDRPGLAISPGTGGTTALLYVTWRNRQGLMLASSTDGGRHFGLARMVVRSDGVYAPVITLGSRRNLAIAFELETPAPNGPNNTLKVIRSQDGGASFDTPVRIGTMTDTLTPHPGIIIPTPPWIAADPTTGALDLVYQDAEQRQPRIEISRSADGGAHWSPARPLPLAASEALGFQPHIAIEGDGTVDVTADLLNHGRVTVELVRSPDGGTNFQAPTQVSTTSFDPRRGVINPQAKGGGGAYWWIGDYQGLAAGGGQIYPCWTDTRTGRAQIFVSALPEGR